MTKKSACRHAASPTKLLACLHQSQHQVLMDLRLEQEDLVGHPELAQPRGRPGSNPHCHPHPAGKDGFTGQPEVIHGLF